jgi:hypothetical protein
MSVGVTVVKSFVVVAYENFLDDEDSYVLQHAIVFI